MKNLLFFTCHNQYKCFEAWSKLFNKNSFLKTFDIMIFNDTGEDEAKLIANASGGFHNKTTTLSTNIVGGYILGLFKDLSQCYDHFSQYNYVFHIHPDVYVLDDVKLKVICEKNKNNDSVFFVSLYTRDKDVYNTDFFIFKPKLLPKNIFEEAEEELNKLPDNLKCAERTLFNLIKKYNLKVSCLSRYPNDLIDGRNRQIDQLNLLHTHQKLVL